MEVLINELSLNGQFLSKHKFLDNLQNILHIIKLIEKLEFNLLKHHSLYSSQITMSETFIQITQSRDDRIRKLKSSLLKLSDQPPFWNETQRHNCHDSYTYNTNNICNTSLAESCERDKMILSFIHSDFSQVDLLVQKNNTNIDIYNIIDKDQFLEYLLSNSQIEPLTYCQLKFENSNLNFSKIENRYEFDSLVTQEQIEAFILAFDGFSKMSWEDIIKSDSLEYKQYSKPKKKKKGWFRDGLYKNTDIYKFRVTQTYRCFGYREKDKFFVLRFEIDHKISDKG